ncbi:uncharacterized protein LOC110699620 isoform X1 [Chenopodium quinoa]|uniref:uncharacterized protein LOC110699620 isoform X1 n=2 Tax=Chenopodium quinoa TaxID=63459 RepID=UPI000B788878|nr:uncharacterized protein LOC110699620 isoform X1 [Chenopodium quinoa]
MLLENNVLPKGCFKERLELHICISITIPTSVYGHEQKLKIDYAYIFYWCFQREIGASHLSIFMKYLSEMCKQDSVAGMYGFCDIGCLSPLTPMTEEGWSDYLACVFGQNEGKNLNQLFFAPYKENPWNAVVFWLDPDGAENEISEFAQKTINDGIKKFSYKHRKDIIKIKKNPGIRWKKPQCPRQSLNSCDNGYYVCRYMLETIDKRRQVIPDQIDELRDLWVNYVNEHKQVGEEYDDVDYDE